MYINGSVRVCCKNCANWNGRIEYGDCYCVIGELEPKLLECYSDNGYQLQLPFDPHDANKYYTKSSKFRVLYNKIKKQTLPDGIRRVLAKEKDVNFTEDGAPKTFTSEVMYLKTRADKCCVYWRVK